ncbi:MAG: redoxin domain-containing protein [Gemmatimonadota bacterium]
MTLRGGDRAPSLRLPDRPGHEVTVEPAGRPIVLLFFPLAFSSVCTREMCSVRDDWSRWRALDADVYAISVDSPFVTAKFHDEHDLPFPVLSDFNREVSTRFGILYEDFYGLRGVAKRAAFVIDSDGSIVYDWVSDDAELVPDYETVKAAVAGAAEREA